MNDRLTAMSQSSQKSTLGDRIRNIANQLRQESDIQIKATSRILGAAAQMSENHEQLIDEVVAMVEADLTQYEHPKSIEISVPKTYTIEQLQHQFGSFKAAKTAFNLKAKSWDILVEKLNKTEATYPDQIAGSQARLIEERFQQIESEIQALKADLKQVISLLSAINSQSQ